VGAVVETPDLLARQYLVKKPDYIGKTVKAVHLADVLWIIYAFCDTALLRGDGLASKAGPPKFLIVLYGGSKTGAQIQESLGTSIPVSAHASSLSRIVYVVTCKVNL